MKKMLLLIAFLGGFALMPAQAQQCNGKTKAASTEVAPATDATAIQAALRDETVEVRKDEQTGQTIFLRKNVCQGSGKVSYSPIEYCSKSGKFVSAKPSQCTKSTAASTKVAADSKTTGACCAKSGKAAAVSSCCSAAQKANCGDAKAKTEPTKSESSKKVKLVKSGV